MDFLELEDVVLAVGGGSSRGEAVHVDVVLAAAAAGTGGAELLCKGVDPEPKGTPTYPPATQHSQKAHSARRFNNHMRITKSAYSSQKALASGLKNS